MHTPVYTCIHVLVYLSIYVYTYIYIHIILYYILLKRMIPALCQRSGKLSLVDLAGSERVSKGT